MYMLGRIRIAFLFALAFTFFLFYLYLYTDAFSSRGLKTVFEHDSGDFVHSPRQQPTKETLKSLFLTEEQCASTFPELFKEIDRAVGLGPFELRKGPDDYSGAVQGRIKNGKVTRLEFNVARIALLTSILAIYYPSTARSCFDSK